MNLMKQQSIVNSIHREIFRWPKLELGGADITKSALPGGMSLTPTVAQWLVALFNPS